MIELDKPFQRDRHNLWYLNSCDVDLIPFKFNDLGRDYNERTQFFQIIGVSKYIVKDTTLYPFFFNGPKTISILKQLRDKQECFNDIDFPIGYLKEKGSIIGTIIPYYEKAPSLREFIYLQKFSELKMLYYHEEDDIDNLVALLLNILDLISKMYNENMVYLDIHSGNFLFYKNNIKIIDFEPGYIYFTNKKDKYYYRLMKNYTMLVEKICKRLGFEEITLNPGESFMETENKVKKLSKRLER